MTADKLRRVIEIYRKKFEELNIEKVNYPHKKFLDIPKHALEHCHGMLDQMLIFIEQDRFDKVYRWLGFIQGCLWSHGIYVLEDLKNQNRKDPGT